MGVDGFFVAKSMAAKGRNRSDKPSCKSNRGKPASDHFRLADQPSRILIDQMKCTVRARSRLEQHCGRPVRAGLSAGEDL
jgi:hypothetical protein